MTAEEQRLTARLQQQVGTVATPPSVLMQWTDAVVADSVFAIDASVNEVVTDRGAPTAAAAGVGIVPGAPLERRNSIGVQPPRAGSALASDVAAVGGMLPTQTAVQLYCNACELVWQRIRLLSAMYDTEVLGAIYTAQACGLGREARPLVLEPVTWEAGGRTELVDEAFAPSLADAAVSTQPRYVLPPMLAEIDKHLAAFDFDTPAGLRALVTDDNLSSLRTAVQTQLATTHMLSMAVRLNQVRAVADLYLGLGVSDIGRGPQIPLDSFLKTWLLRDPSQEKTFVTREQYDREQARLKAARTADLEQITVYFVSIAEIKARSRAAVFGAYTERCVGSRRGTVRVLILVQIPQPAEGPAGHDGAPAAHAEGATCARHAPTGALTCAANSSIWSRATVRALQRRRAHWRCAGS
jgi:hypothetical protein